MRGGAFTIDVSDERSGTKTYEVRSRDGAREELQSSRFPRPLLEAALHAVSRSKNPGEFMKFVKAADFRAELDLMQASSKIPYETAMAVLATLTVAEQVMSE